MAVDRQIINDGFRNVVVRFTGLLEGGDVVLQPALEVGDCQTNDTGMGTLSGFGIREAHYSTSSGLLVALYWNSDTPQLALALAGSAKVGGRQWSTLLPDTSLSGFDGSLTLETKGAVPATPSSFTLELHLRKIYQQ